MQFRDRADQDTSLNKLLRKKFDVAAFDLGLEFARCRFGNRLKIAFTIEQAGYKKLNFLKAEKFARGRILDDKNGCAGRVLARYLQICFEFQVCRANCSLLRLSELTVEKQVVH